MCGGDIRYIFEKVIGGKRYFCRFVYKGWWV